MSTIRVVAVDMDGTFLRPDDTYDSDRFARMRAIWDAEGVRFVVASGNQYAQLASFFPIPISTASLGTTVLSSWRVGRNCLAPGSIRPW